MINQTRTLLTNKPAAFFSTLPTPTYVPPAFVPLELSSAFSEFYSVLFPVSTDPFVVDKLAGSIMQALHSADLEPYTLYPDTRITYGHNVPEMSDFALSPVTLTMSVDITDVVPHYRLMVSGTPTDIRFAGEHKWRCTRADNFTLNVQYSRQSMPDQYKVTTGSTTSAKVPLFPGYLDLYFDLPSKYLTGNFVLEVQLVVEPVFNLGNCLADLKALLKHVSLLSSLFAPAAGYATQLAQLKTTYLNSPESILQFGSLVLPYAYQCDVLRTKV